MARRSIARTAALAAAAVALAAPILAQAHDYRRSYYEDACTDRIHDNGVTGALLGGAAGAVLGSNLAGHGARTGGALLGGAAGAVVGSNIARSTTKDGCRGPREVVYDYAPPPRPVYVRPEPVYYAPPPRPVYVAPAPVYYAPAPVTVYESYDGGHDHGRHRGWYEHHHHDDDDD